MAFASCGDFVVHPARQPQRRKSGFVPAYETHVQASEFSRLLLFNHCGVSIAEGSGGFMPPV
jgi:hypothetical protein